MIFDTGCTPPIMVQDIHVGENNLPVFFFDSEKKKSGLAIAKSIKSGSLIFESIPCLFFGESPRWTLLGVPVTRETHFVIGLPTIKGFRYCKFDQINNRVQLSAKTVFTPKNIEDWVTYPFELKGVHLLLDIPIEGIETTLMLDTGACMELQLSDTSSEKLYEKREDFKKAWKFKTRLFVPHMNREVHALKFDAKHLMLGGHVLNKVKVFSAPMIKDIAGYDGIIGMKLFKKTAMVLDFDKNLMWVKKTKGSLF
ncbi:MAG: hypothetical protein FVQ79_10690 [Planctomycetes bacterium]|nr:hypothetical protein [Planctomycetota bacterium]